EPGPDPLGARTLSARCRSAPVRARTRRPTRAWVYSGDEMSDGSPFDARCDRREDAAVVAVSGELDLDSAEKLRALLLSPPAQAETVVLDLRAVTFIDSSGLSVVVGHHHRPKTERFRFAVAVGGAPAVEP